MPSIAHQRWRTIRATSLHRVEVAHTSVGGTGVGARFAREQLNRSYCVLLAAEFQGFCRDLHDEAVTAVCGHLPGSFGLLLDGELKRNRQLDRGNANPANLGGDFGRFGFTLWTAFDAAEPPWPDAASVDGRDERLAECGGSLRLRSGPPGW